MPRLGVSVQLLVTGQAVVVRLLTLGGSPLYGNCKTWIMSSLFSFKTYFHEMSGTSLKPEPMA